MNTESSTTPAGGSAAAAQTPSAVSDAQQTRSARIAVTVFPVLVIVGGILGLLASDAFAAMSAGVPWALGVIMFLMGLTLTMPDFARIAKRPWIVLIGAAMQFVIMPLAGLAIVKLLQLDPMLAVGVILVGCAPGGTASNVVTFLSRGDVALSVTVTTVSTLLAPLLTPFLTLWLAGSYLEVSAGAMMMSIIQTVFIPVVLGIIVRVVASKAVEAIAPALPWLSALTIAWIVAVVVAGSKASLASAGLIVLLAVILHNAVGLGVGYGVGRIMGLNAPERRALTIEVGMQNSGLAASLATAHFSPLAALPGAVFSVWHNLSGALIATVFARTPLEGEKQASADRQAHPAEA